MDKKQNYRSHIFILALGIFAVVVLFLDDAYKRRGMPGASDSYWFIRMALDAAVMWLLLIRARNLLE